MQAAFSFAGQPSALKAQAVAIQGSSRIYTAALPGQRELLSPQPVEARQLSTTYR
jgi:hypothetical protein